MHVLLAMSGSSALVLAFSILLVLRPRPWYDARILLPAVGILLSNTISGGSLGLSAALQELTAGGTPAVASVFPATIHIPHAQSVLATCMLAPLLHSKLVVEALQTQQGIVRSNRLHAGRERVELLLSIGASRMEATKGVIQRSIVTALTPALNQMSVVGLVSLPEFLSGQLAAGVSTYQVGRLLLQHGLNLHLLCRAHNDPSLGHRDQAMRRRQ